MMRALDDECRACGAMTVRLGPGERRAIVAAGSTYGFMAPTPVDASGGDPVVLIHDRREVEGIVTGVRDGECDLTLVEDIGATVPAGAELLLDAPWLLRRLRDRVRDAFEVGLMAPRLFNLRGGLLTLGIGEIGISPDGVTPSHEDSRQPLNEAQTRAVERVFRAPLSVLAAPGGTGKTVALGAVVEACYRAGLRALVCAPSNIAVDLQMMQLCARLEREPGFAAGEVLRVGQDVGPDVRSRWGELVAIDDVVGRLRPKLRQRLARQQRTVDALASALTAAFDAARHAPDAAADARVSQARQALASARAELRLLRRELRDFARSLAAEARVVGATLAHVHLDQHLGTFDVVVIDEASMAVPPAVFIAAGLARRHVVIGGDPYQLAAPVRSPGPHRHWLAEDVFTKLEVVSAIREDEDVSYVTLLEEQRRCAEDICALLREVWYGPRLRTAPEVIRRERARHNVVFGTAALCYIDTSSLDPRAYNPWSRTWANDEHARVIAHLIEYLDSAGELPEGGCTSGEVLALSHYRGQVANIRRHLGNRYHGRGVSVCTVHRSQGSEASTCILDLTLARHLPTRTSNVLTATRPDEEGSRLLAVAASRARSRFILLGDLRWLEDAVAPHSVLGRIWSHLREHGYAIALEEVMPAAMPRMRLVR
jgi:hypothetical protein